MKKIDLGQTLNTLANVGVIAGIVFLGLELSQNNDILESHKLAALSSLRASGYQAVLQNPVRSGPLFRLVLTLNRDPKLIFAKCCSEMIGPPGRIT